LTDLGVLANQTESAALAINGVGQIVGASDNIEPVTYHELSRKSFFYDNGNLIALNVPGQHNSATDINDFRADRGNSCRPTLGTTNDGYIYDGRSQWRRI
jgi:uncharacterized membrane protein